MVGFFRRDRGHGFLCLSLLEEQVMLCVYRLEHPVGVSDVRGAMREAFGFVPRQRALERCVGRLVRRGLLRPENGGAVWLPALPEEAFAARLWKVRKNAFWRFWV